LLKRPLNDKQEIIHLLNLIQRNAKKEELDSSIVTPAYKTLHQNIEEISLNI
jgi:hypothetical protein